MNRSLSLGLVAAISLATTISARAADLPWRQQPLAYKTSTLPFNWTGLYIGANGGYGWGQSSWSDPAVGADSGKFSTSGALAGGQLGYNWQIGALVFGIETDIDWTNITGSTGGVGGVCAADGGGPCQTQQNWIGTTRARLGYAYERWLPFITGGVAYGDIEAVQPGGNTSTTNVGWTVGGGLEFAFDRNWSAKVEYLHIDLGSANLTGSATGTTTLSVPVTDDVVRAGLNFRF